MQPVRAIERVLPQRYPFLFIDAVLSVDKKKAVISCLKNVTINEQFFQGHFPGNPVMPGALIIEAMAQAGILLFAELKPKVMKKKPAFFLGKVQSRFLLPVRPGDQLIIEVRGEKVLDTGGMVTACAKVKDKTVAEAEIFFGVRGDK